MTYTVLQKREMPDGSLKWVRVADGFKTLDEARKVAGSFRGWLWWGPSKSAVALERGEVAL